MRRITEESDVEFVVTWHPYFLDAGLPQTGMTKRDYYQVKGLTEAKMTGMSRKMSKLFEVEGLTYTLDGNIGSTFDSHRLAEWALTTYGAKIQDKLVEAMFRKYFSEAQSPADLSALLAAAEEAGIDWDAAKQFLTSESARQRTFEIAQNFMVATGVPHYFMELEGAASEEPKGGVVQVPGAQDEQTFYHVLSSLIRKAEQRTSASSMAKL
uniref:DSBA-like thioredoxin domain-containing protein n=1 Tax=Noctiluca scintillans TaxID=2966 RepID=A0A7S1A1G3_NOCSC|mmetsp:Transcript_27682/g.73027  ORF Transcript_27682/g.73027 Transcript_27682/m.73027 type:complete len:211 (+) Transcript_27682:118-750(+)